MTHYFPTVNASELQKIKLTANRVGLDLPAPFCDAIGESQQPSKEEIEKGTIAVGNQ
jgi:hypothetical protein